MTEVPAGEGCCGRWGATPEGAAQDALDWLHQAWHDGHRGWRRSVRAQSTASGALSSAVTT